jgi:hypothetical protein
MQLSQHHTPRYSLLDLFYLYFFDIEVSKILRVEVPSEDYLFVFDTEVTKIWRVQVTSISSYKLYSLPIKLLDHSANRVDEKEGWVNVGSSPHRMPSVMPVLVFGRHCG